jgi:hypothetical protein
LFSKAVALVDIVTEAIRELCPFRRIAFHVERRASCNPSDLQRIFLMGVPTHVIAGFDQARVKRDSGSIAYLIRKWTMSISSDDRVQPGLG